MKLSKDASALQTVPESIKQNLLSVSEIENDIVVVDGGDACNTPILDVDINTNESVISMSQDVESYCSCVDQVTCGGKIDVNVEQTLHLPPWETTCSTTS